MNKFLSSLSLVVWQFYLWQDLDSVRVNAVDSFFRAADSQHYYGIVLLYINLLITLVNVLLFGLNLFYFLPAIDYARWWRKQNLKNSKKH